jgi:hypothetical protein
VKGKELDFSTVQIVAENEFTSIFVKQKTSKNLVE